MEFKLWSELSSDAWNELSPDFGFRSWNALVKSDCILIWKHLENHFFNSIAETYVEAFSSEDGPHFPFMGREEEQRMKRDWVLRAIIQMNYRFKAKNYTPKFLYKKTYYAACLDFYTIFIKENESAVLELISLYTNEIIKEYNYDIDKDERETDIEFNKRKEDFHWGTFD